MKVYLHTGAGKTGTSAIQTALAALRPQLAEAGIYYPDLYRPTRAKPSRSAEPSGNAYVLGAFLNTQKKIASFNRDAVTDWLHDGIRQAEGRDILYSSEAMQFAQKLEFGVLSALFAEAGYEITIIHYVRHLLDYAISAYLQRLKRGNVEGADVLLRRRVPFLRTLDTFSESVPAERIIVRLYDLERTDLVAGFLRILTDKAFVLPVEDKTINRSPTPAEQVVFTALSRLTSGQRICRLVTEHLLNRPSANPVETSVTTAEFADFSRRNKSVVEALNRRFFGGENVVKLKSARITVGEARVSSPDEVAAAFTEALSVLDVRLRAKVRAELRKSGHLGG